MVPCPSACGGNSLPTSQCTLAVILLPTLRTSHSATSRSCESLALLVFLTPTQRRLFPKMFVTDSHFRYLLLPWALKLWSVEYEQHHSCWCPQGNSRKPCQAWYFKGEVTELPFLYQTECWSSALAIGCGRSIITGAFPPLICAYLFILAFFFFHSLLVLVLPEVVQWALQCPKVPVLRGKAASGPGLSWTLVSPCSQLSSSCVCCARDDSLLAWEGTKPSSPEWAGLHVKWKLSLFTNWSKWLCYWHRLHYVSHSILWKRGQNRKRVMAGRGKFHFFLNWVETSSGKLKKNPREEEQKK